MKYLILIYGNPESRAIWEGFTDTRRDEGFAYYAGLTEDLVASGELIATEALTDASMTKRVTVHDGQTMTTDGPFAEAKELLAGFYLLECESLERAIECAARVPEAEFGLVEVRPVLEFGGPQM
ncbi:MAG: YciI family protein [Propionibacteriales bacterium]|nr:YciI family protein [Propionibacteriales bacterium]